MGKLSLNQWTNAARETMLSFSAEIAWIGGTTERANPNEISERDNDINLYVHILNISDSGLVLAYFFHHWFLKIPYTYVYQRDININI